MMHDVTTYRFGVNYTPTRSWWYCWNDFEADAIAKDLDAIRFLGADHIRIQAIWPYFQPNPQSVSQAHLDRLHVLMELAAERDLDVCVCLFVGWLSGYAFKPAFQPDELFYQLDAYTLPYQEHYLTGMVKALQVHDNFLGIDLGNELNCCWQAEETPIGDGWHRHMLDHANRLHPQGIHVNGVDHVPWFKPATFSPACMATTQRILPLHCWTFFTGAYERSKGNVLDPRCLGLPRAMAALARSYAGDSAHPIWIQEYGMSEDWTSTAEIPRFLRESTLDAIQGGVNWFTWWCSHDLDRQYAFHPLEYSLGLITLDQKLKPQGEAFKEIADAYRGRPVVPSPRTERPAPPASPDLDSTWEWLEAWLATGP